MNTPLPASAHNDEPARRLHPRKTREALRLFNISLGLRGVFDIVCGGTSLPFVSYALALGVARERLGLVTTAASVACILQMLGLVLISRVRQKKEFVLRMAFFEPLLVMAAVLLIPFLPPPWRFPLLLAAVFLAAAALHLTKPFTDGWIAALIPAGIRGRYLGRRIQIHSVSLVAAALGSGWLLQYAVRGRLLGLAVLLGAGAAFGLLAVWPLRRAEIPAVAATAHMEWRDFRSVLGPAHRDFHRYLLGVSLHWLPLFLAIPYYQVYYLRILHMPESWIGGLLCLYLVAKTAGMPLCARLVQRQGIRNAMLSAGVLYVLFFLSFPMSAPGRIAPLLLGWLLASQADGISGVALTSALYRCVPAQRHRVVFFAMNNLVALGGFGLGGITAMLLLKLLGDTHIVIGRLVVGQFQVFYTLIALLMGGCLFSALLIAGPRRAGIRE